MKLITKARHSSKKEQKLMLKYMTFKLIECFVFLGSWGFYEFNPKYARDILYYADEEE